MAQKRFITDSNLQHFAGIVKGQLDKKIAKGGLKTINGQSLEGSGNIELDFTVAEVVTSLPDIKSAVKTKIYLLASTASETNNAYGEYIKVTVNGTDKWEKLGEYKTETKLTWDAISGKPSTFSPSAHKHTKSEITDFPSSMPASDVYTWAKAQTKPSYTKSEVGLGNVDNTSDANKPVSTAQQAALDKKMSLADVPTDTVTNVVVEKATATVVPLGVYKRTKKEASGSVGFSDSGTQINITAATASTAGVMSAEDKTKLTKLGLYSLAQANNANGGIDIKLSKDGTVQDTVNIPNAVYNLTVGTGNNGLMSMYDKEKLDSINFTDLTNSEIDTLWNNA